MRRQVDRQDGTPDQFAGAGPARPHRIGIVPGTTAAFLGVMHRVLLPGTGLSVSPLCLGGIPFGSTLNDAETFALLDQWVELGGNFVDTARVYSDWIPGEKRRSERVLGDWLRTRGLRNRMVIGTKGAHPFLEAPGMPRTSAAEIRDDLEGSLRTLGVDAIDLYWLHRDDPARPVGHFVDLLDGFVREGRIRAWGVSNWSGARMEAAWEYAHASGRLAFAANQPFWSLGCQQARPPKIPGLVKFDAAAHAFHARTGLAVVPYSSQAGGFFSQLALPRDRRRAGFASDDFHTPANLAVGEIVMRLARDRQVAPSAIVLAYLRSRPFPVVPIVGCQTPAQLADSVAALPVRLTVAELKSLETAAPSGLPVGT